MSIIVKTLRVLAHSWGATNFLAVTHNAPKTSTKTILIQAERKIPICLQRYSVTGLASYNGEVVAISRIFNRKSVVNQISRDDNCNRFIFNFNLGSL